MSKRNIRAMAAATLFGSLLLTSATAAAAPDRDDQSHPPLTFQSVVYSQNGNRDPRFTQLLGVNDQGQMVGGYGDGTIILRFLEHHGFLLSEGVFTTFDAPFAGVAITPFGRINNSGQIAGYYLDANGTFFGFIANVGL